MPLTAENYPSQTILAKRKIQARNVWIVFMVIVLIWNFLIIFAPIAHKSGLMNISAPIYKFFSFLCHQISARSFHIHEYPFAVCARCFGFYAGFLSGIAVYPLFRSFEDTSSFPRFWLFAAMIPIAVDFSLTIFGVWENTHLSRLITGAILGFACAFFIIPALVEIRILLAARRSKK